MRRIATILLSVLMLFSVAGCGNYSMHEAESDANKVKDEVKDEISDMMPSDNNSHSDTHNSTDTASAKISANDARKRALEHARVDENDANDFDIDKETHNGVLCFDVSFETKDYEYEYKIDAATGKVLNSKKENR